MASFFDTLYVQSHLERTNSNHSTLEFSDIRDDNLVSPVSYEKFTIQCMGAGRHVIIAACLLAIPFFFNWVFAWTSYHWTHNMQMERKAPPEYPAVLPLLGSTLSFLWDSASFVEKATKYSGKLSAVRINLLVNGIYMFQDPAAVAAMWKNAALSSPIYVYTVGLRYIFGMKDSAIETYTADDSGPHRKPYPDSNVPVHNRIDFLTHDLLLRGMTGPALAPTFERYQSIFQRSLEADEIGDEWVERPDLFAFFREHVGKSVLESLFGPSLFRINPQFIEDLWLFDKQVKNLAKRLPRFLIPNAYRVRERLLEQIQRWYVYARQNFREDALYQDGDGDPFWGSSMNRERQATILNIDGQDDAALASADLGLIWTSITNVVPSTMMVALHTFKDPELLERIRTSTADVHMCTESGHHVDMKRLLSKDLLQSTYAETLRLYAQSYITRCSPHQDIALGKWWLPRNEVSMVSSYVSHMDTEVWNTREGEHPVTSFWADRFLVDESDDRSGPLRRAVTSKEIKSKSTLSEPRFSLQGLSGSWIPYGGGFSACPGRLLAKRIILFTCAQLVKDYDIQIRTTNFKMDSSDFGLGTQKPKVPIAFAIRRRKSA